MDTIFGFPVIGFRPYPSPLLMDWEDQDLLLFRCWAKDMDTKSRFPVIDFRPYPSPLLMDWGRGRGYFYWEVK